MEAPQCCKWFSNARKLLNVSARIWNHSYAGLMKPAIIFHDSDLGLSKYNYAGPSSLKELPIMFILLLFRKNLSYLFSLVLSSLAGVASSSIIPADEWYSSTYPSTLWKYGLGSTGVLICTPSNHPTCPCPLKATCETATWDINKLTPLKVNAKWRGKKKKKYSLCHLADSVMACPINNPSR